MGGIAHFEIHVDDTERAKAFYGALFGWTFIQASEVSMEYWLIDVGDQSQGGGILKRSGPLAPVGSSPSSFVCTIGVESVDASLAAAVKAGGQVAVPKMGIGGMGWVAYLLDTEGNIFGIFETDPSAESIPPGEA